METQALNSDPTTASRYLADQLTDTEREAFEAALERDPDVLRELEATARFKMGLHQLRAKGELDELLRSQPAWPWIAMAATLGGIVIGVALWRLAPGPSAGPLLAATASAFSNDAGHPLPLSGAFVVYRTRGSSSTNIELPSNRAAIELRVFPELTPQPPSYSARLSPLASNGSAPPTEALRGIVPDQEGFVHLYVDSSSLTVGRYQLVLNGEPAKSDNSETFDLNVVSGSARGSQTGP